jgi:hypothetical protein
MEGAVQTVSQKIEQNKSQNPAHGERKPRLIEQAEFAVRNCDGHRHAAGAKDQHGNSGGDPHQQGVIPPAPC